MTFAVGDRVWVPETPWVVEVLEISVCGECGRETFRFLDPLSGIEDWAHASEFEEHPLSNFDKEDR